MTRSPFEPLLLAARGTRRRRAVIIITMAALGYMVRYCPQEIWNHWFEILQILIGLTVLDLVQETINVPDSSHAPRLLPTSVECPHHPGELAVDGRGRTCGFCRAGVRPYGQAPGVTRTSDDPPSGDEVA